MTVTDITKIGDPQILLYEGKYYCYATSSDKGFFVWSSDDLVNWSEPSLCFRAIDYWGISHFWAPEVVYRNGKFVMHYTAMSGALNSLRIGVAVSDSPIGPFADVHNAPMFDLGYAAIDGSVLIDDEEAYLYYSRDCSENIVDGVHTSQIYCVRLNSDLTETVGEHILISTPDKPYELKSMALELPCLWNEGPTVIKQDGLYFMNYSANCYATNDYAICLSVAQSPTGPFEKAASNPVLSCRADLFGAGHNAFFSGKDGALYTSFHIQTDPEHPSGDRRVVIGKTSITKVADGWVQTIS